MKNMTVCVIMLLAFSAALLSTTVAQNQAGYTASSSAAGNNTIAANATTTSNSNTAGTANNASVQVNPGAKTTNVAQLANVTSIFGPNKAEAVSIVQVNSVGGMWIGIGNQGITATNLTGWRLKNNANSAYVFPNINLDPGSIVRVHQGSGRSSTTDLYTNSTAPLFSNSGDMITLLDAQGEIAAEYNTTTGSAPAPTVTPVGPAAAPLLVNATTQASVKSPGTQPVLITPGAPNTAQNPSNAPVLITNPLQANATVNQTCPLGQNLCNGTCTDTSVDSQNCGKCGNICPADSNCIDGVCSSPCLPGQTSCNGNCVDTSSDSQNCGKCGNVCPANAVCINGVCSAYPAAGVQQ